MVLDEVLTEVSKPTRYMGNELHAVVKPRESVALRVALAFPDVYEVGMSHLGLKILYHILNSQEEIWAERVFAPWVDMEEKMRERGIPLFALESRDPLTQMDMIGFSLQYELSYTNILNMLDLGGIPLFSSDRGEEDPLIIAGGPCAFNPEPLAPFLDAVLLGDGEEAILEMAQVALAWRRGEMDREQTLQRLAGVDGVYVPSLYEITPSGAQPLTPQARNPVVKRVLADLDQAPFPTRPVLPYMQVIHDRAVVELFRGCTHGCRFCQAGMVYRPLRERSPETLRMQVKEMLKETGYEELSLSSLSSSDYSCIGGLVTDLVEDLEGVTLSLPSLRIDNFSLDLAEKVQHLRKGSLTFAPEAGTQRLRNVINKGVTSEDLVETASRAFEAGWSGIKLYFMLGLPTETDEDLEGIVSLARDVLASGRRSHGGRARVSVSVSTFVPKPHTPFQWVGQISQAEIRRRQDTLQQRLRGNGLSLSTPSFRVSTLEAAFARGDRQMAQTLYAAWQKGCRFDGWSECFRYDLWQEAFDQTGIDLLEAAQRTWGQEDLLPWDHLSAGVSKSFLWREYQQALREATTPNCRGEACPGCSVCPTLNVEHRKAQEEGEA